MLMTKFCVGSFVALFMLALGCGDDAKPKVKCPAGVVAGTVQACTCGDSGIGTQTCAMDLTLTDCICIAGGTAGTTAGATAGTTGVGVAGTTATSGTGGSDEDGGTSTAGTSGGTSGTSGGTAGTGATGPKQPPADGSQGSSCTMGGTACDGDLTCYTANATPVGFCTAKCTTDDDCKDIKGGTYTCSSPAGLGGVQACRASCTGLDDKSCPEFMSCTPVTGGFRCLYDAKDVGPVGTAKRWAKCASTSDCSGDLVCYTPPTSGGFPGGTAYLGFCTSSCTTADDCKDNPPTGTATAGCSTTTSQCRLICSAGGGGFPGGGGGGAVTCPDGMVCANPAGTGSRCMYEDTGGGI